MLCVVCGLDAGSGLHHRTLATCIAVLKSELAAAQAETRRLRWHLSVVDDPQPDK